MAVNHMELVQLGANYSTIIQGVVGIVMCVLTVVTIKNSTNSGSLKKNSPVIQR